VAARAQGGGEKAPFESKSSGGDDEEEDEDGEVGEVTPPPHSLSPKDLPSLGDIFSRQAGISVGTHRPKRPRTETGSLTSLPLQPYLALVSPDLQGVSVVSAVTGMSHLLGVLQVPLCLLTAGVATAMMAGLISSGVGDAEPSAKKACPWSLLPVSSRYDVVCWFTPLPFFLFLF
jgi:hypothetical protein